ncbi:MAG: hypothetical protein KJN97_12090 [Deltaproteobacteria bacterium]|nr:hypothetical protein [Deltaproteobacteria bacterium]
MKYVGIMLAALMFIGAGASAQEDAAGGASTAEAQAADATTAEAPAEAPQEEKRSPYYKKVQGWLWIEAFAGPSSFDPDRFGTLSIDGAPNAPKVNGPQFGFAIGTGFGGPFFLGAYYRQASYTKSAPPGFGYKLLKVGLDMQGNFRFVPYVHPIIRIAIGYARTFDGSPYGLANTDVDGLDFTAGVGLRIPIVRWMSFAATFDWSFVGLSVRGDDPNTGNRFTSKTGGQQLAGTFALTFHFIGVRKD